MCALHAGAYIVSLTLSEPFFVPDLFVFDSLLLRAVQLVCTNQPPPRDRGRIPVAHDSDGTLFEYVSRYLRLFVSR